MAPVSAINFQEFPALFAVAKHPGINQKRDSFWPSLSII
jgi:hypothetical protein